MRKKQLRDQNASPLKDVAMLFAGVVAIIYLLNPDAGLIELIPDNIPVIGNLDEFAASVLIFRVWRYFRRYRPGWLRRGGRAGRPEDTDA